MSEFDFRTTFYSKCLECCNCAR